MSPTSAVKSPPLSPVKKPSSTNGSSTSVVTPNTSTPSSSALQSSGPCTMSSKARPVIIHLCIEQYCIIFQLRWAIRILSSLRGFLSDHNITFISFRMDLVHRNLRTHCGLMVQRWEDITEDGDEHVFRKVNPEHKVLSPSFCYKAVLRGRIESPRVHGISGSSARNR